MKAHGGRIQAESNGPRLGARFTFTLPTVGKSGMAYLPLAFRPLIAAGARGIRGRRAGLSETVPGKRSFFNHHFIDGVFLLGRGYVILDALPIRSYVDQAIELGQPVSPKTVWIWSRENELLMLWALINQVNARLLWGEADLNNYIGAIQLFLDGPELET